MKLNETNIVLSYGIFSFLIIAYFSVFFSFRRHAHNLFSTYTKLNFFASLARSLFHWFWYQFYSWMFFFLFICEQVSNGPLNDARNRNRVRERERAPELLKKSSKKSNRFSGISIRLKVLNCITMDVVNANNCKEQHSGITEIKKREEKLKHSPDYRVLILQSKRKKKSEEFHFIGDGDVVGDFECLRKNIFLRNWNNVRREKKMKWNWLRCK